MNFLQAIILSIVEGITEFLPISSTGHLVLIAEILKIPQTEFVKSFEIIIQLGAILAVLVIYYRKFLEGLKIWKPVLAAFIPTGIIGFLLYKFIKEFLIGNNLITILALFFGGILLIILEKIHQEKDSKIEKTEKISLKTAAFIGVIQALSVIPGISRSAASILGGMFLGLNRKTAVEFSFLLAIPTMFAATGYDLLKTSFQFNTQEITVLIVGLIVSFLVALLVVKWFIKYVEKNSFFWFGVYRILIALLFWFIISH